MRIGEGEGGGGGEKKRRCCILVLSLPERGEGWGEKEKERESGRSPLVWPAREKKKPPLPAILCCTSAREKRGEKKRGGEKERGRRGERSRYGKDEEGEIRERKEMAPSLLLSLASSLKNQREREKKNPGKKGEESVNSPELYCD